MLRLSRRFYRRFFGRRALTVVLLAMTGTLAPEAARMAWAGEAGEWPFTAEEQGHWAYQPIRRPAVPPVRQDDMVRTPVDAFVLSRLEEQGLSLSPPAGRRAMLRRGKFDLLGLPPTEAEIDAFLSDDSQDAYERMIERLLASPHYGEAWGRTWLDLVRFAETAGFNADPPRPLAYKYRDYVIRAFNDNRPYDRFIKEQLAGDELYPDDPQALVATGYTLMWPDESNASDVLLARQDALNDLTANVGAVFLGASIGCAQCHDHKFDPLLQQDFYSLQAFFAGIVPEERVPVGSNSELAAYEQALGEWHRQTESVRGALHAIEQTARAKAGRVKRLKFPQVVLDAIDTAPERRTAYQRQLVFWSERQIVFDEKQLLAQMSDEEKQRRDALRAELAQRVEDKPQPPGWLKAMAVAEAPGGPPPTYLLAGGSYEYPSEQVEPAVLSVLQAGGVAGAEIESPRASTSGRRAALARWMTSRDNPLVARVMVNRIWEGHFGKGLVENANDFGTQTPLPTHPQLLDWLAGEFVAQGWSVKAMHRLIMASGVYRQASERRGNVQAASRAADLDPENRLYRHYPRRRLSAERLRDSLLAVAGTLNTEMYGPGVRPSLPPDFSKREKWETSKSETQRNRRSVYIYAKRNLPYPLLQAFDFPDMHEACAQRAETTTAPQALMLLNSDLVLDTAEDFADRLLDDDGAWELSFAVARAYVIALGREATEAEAAVGVRFIQQQRRLLADESMSDEAASRAALADFCHALLNANEFLYVD